MTILFRALAGFSVLALSFGLTLLIIEYQPEPSAIELAMAAEGLSAADAVIGNIDVSNRDSTGRLELSGWAFDKELAAPVTVLVLVGSKLEPVAVTNGARDDVTRALHETPQRAKNVTFTGRTERPIDCGPHFVIGANQKKHMSILNPSLVPPQCKVGEYRH